MVKLFYVLFVAHCFMHFLGPILSASSLSKLQNSLVQLKPKLSELSKKLNAFTSRRSSGTKKTEAGLQKALQALYDADIITFGTMQQWQSEEELKLVAITVTPEIAEHLKTLIRNNHQLIGVSLKDVSIENHLLQGLLKTLSQQQKKIKKLVLEEVGFIPENIQLLKSFLQLERLDLSSNKLSEADFAQLASLKRLKQLKLDKCSLTDQDVDSIAKLKNITDLDLRRNRLTNKVISKLLPLHALMTLNLYDNTVQGADFSQLASLKKLKIFALGLCNLIDADLTSLSGLTNLEGLDLAWNKALTSKAINDLQAHINLKRLDLHNCLGKKYPENLGKLEHVGWGLYLPSNVIAQQKLNLTKYPRLLYRQEIPFIEWSSMWCYLDAPITCLAYITPLYDLIQRVSLPSLQSIDEKINAAVDDKLRAKLNKEKLAVTVIEKLWVLLHRLRVPGTNRVQIDYDGKKGEMAEFYDAWIAWSGKSRGSGGDSMEFLTSLFNEILKPFFSNKQNNIIALKFVNEMPSLFILRDDSFPEYQEGVKNKVPFEIYFKNNDYRLVAKVFGRTGHATAMVTTGEGDTLYYNHLGTTRDKVQATDLVSYRFKGYPTMINFYIKTRLEVKKE